MDDPVDHNWLKHGSTSSSDVRKSYDSWAGTYDDDLANWDYRAPAQVAELLKESVSLTSTILDGGCGTGLSGAALRYAGFNGIIDGVDLSTSSLEKASERGIYRKLQQANFQELPLAISDHSYDALICVGVLTYVPDSKAILREFARLVRPEGTVLVTQRDDLFREGGLDQTIQSLVDASVFSGGAVTEPRPYLPNNPDFGSDVNVIYAILTVD